MPRKKRSKSPKVRINVEFLLSELARLDRLIAQTGRRSRTAVIEQAVRVAELIVQAQTEGSEIITRRRDGGSEKTLIIVW